MIDLALLVAVFVAILALAYFTYRNVVGLDTRIRKIEDILQNAEVVSAPPQTGTGEQGETSVEPTQSLPVPDEATENNTRIPGWGGEGPAITVEREQPEDMDADDEYEEEDDDEIEVAEDETDAKEEGDVQNLVEKAPVDDMVINAVETAVSSKTPVTVSSATVNELKEALRKAGVSFPSSAKKAMLITLVQENNVEL